MKNSIFLLFFIFSGITACFSQDILTKINGDTLTVKVIEISESDIKYKRFNMPDGPLYVMSKKEVFIIQFANGHKEYPNPEGQIKKNSRDVEMDEKIVVRGSGFYQDGRRLRNNMLEEVIGESGNQKAMMELKLAKLIDRRKKIMIIAGMPFAIIGTFNIIITSLLINEYKTNGFGFYQDEIDYWQTTRSLGVLSTVGGAMALFFGFSSMNSAKKHRQQAVILYNQSLNSESKTR